MDAAARTPQAVEEADVEAQPGGSFRRLGLTLSKGISCCPLPYLPQLVARHGAENPQGLGVRGEERLHPG